MWSASQQFLPDQQSPRDGQFPVVEVPPSWVRDGTQATREKGEPIHAASPTLHGDAPLFPEVTLCVSKNLHLPSRRKNACREYWHTAISLLIQPISILNIVNNSSIPPGGNLVKSASVGTPM